MTHLIHSIQYVAGGMVNTKTRLSSVERWCPDTNQWEEIKDLPRALSSSCLCACDGKLYLVGMCSTLTFNREWPSNLGGACEGSQTVSSVYSYDPADNEWTECKPLPEPERGVAAVALSGNIYVIGKAGRVYAYSTYVHDPTTQRLIGFQWPFNYFTHRSAEEWRRLRETNGGHLHGAATVFKGRIYVAGLFKVTLKVTPLKSALYRFTLPPDNLNNKNRDTFWELFQL